MLAGSAPRALSQPLVQERLLRRTLTGHAARLMCSFPSASRPGTQSLGTRTLALGLVLLPAEPAGAALSALTPDMLRMGGPDPCHSPSSSPRPWTQSGSR